MIPTKDLTPGPYYAFGDTHDPCLIHKLIWESNPAYQYDHSLNEQRVCVVYDYLGKRHTQFFDPDREWSLTVAEYVIEELELI